MSLFIETLIGQVRALDQFGTWANKSDEDILKEKYVKSKEDLKNIPVIADIDERQIQDIRLIFQAIALAFELKNGIMCSVVMEMSHEGFGRAVVIADKIVVTNKFFKDAHRYSFRTYEELVEQGEKMLVDALKIYDAKIGEPLVRLAKDKGIPIGVCKDDYRGCLVSVEHITDEEPTSYMEDEELELLVEYGAISAEDADICQQYTISPKIRIAPMMLIKGDVLIKPFSL